MYDDVAPTSISDETTSGGMAREGALGLSILASGVPGHRARRPRHAT